MESTDWPEQSGPLKPNNAAEAAGSNNRPGLKQPRPVSLRRMLAWSLALFVIFLVAAGGHSLWTLHYVQHSQETMTKAARFDHQFRIFTERAAHYTEIAPRNYPHYWRDVAVYYTGLRTDLEMLNGLAPHLAEHAGFDQARWSAFLEGLEEQLGDDAERPRLEWATEYIVEHAGPIQADIAALNVRLQDAADRSRTALWASSIALAVATFTLAFITGWLFRKRVLQRVQAASRRLQLMSDGLFDSETTAVGSDELGGLEASVNIINRRTRSLFELLDALHSANGVDEVLDCAPPHLSSEFKLDWLALLEVRSGRFYLREQRPAGLSVSTDALSAGWRLRGSVAEQAIQTGQAVFIDRLPEMRQTHPGAQLCHCLADSGYSNAVFLPVVSDRETAAVLVLASRRAGAIRLQRQRWLRNVGHLIAHAFYRGIHSERLLISMVRGLAELAEKRDPTTGLHLMRMQRYAGIIARELAVRGDPAEALQPHFAEQVELFAPLHDIGKVGISDQILLKSGPLSDEEFAEIRRHPEIGMEVLKACADQLGSIGEKVLAPAINVALYHHEKFDGTGYPHGLRGDEIPLSARIVALADVYDALTSRRPYKHAWSEDEALTHLESQRGRHFDPRVLDAFMARLPEIRDSQSAYSDERLSA